MEQNYVVVNVQNVSENMLPSYPTPGAAGMDLYADLAQPIRVKPGTCQRVPTGLRIALPEGYEAQIRPKSDLALKNGITVLNSPGTVDSDYRGEIGVILVNNRVAGQECKCLRPVHTVSVGEGYSYKVAVEEEGHFCTCDAFTVRPGDCIAYLVVSKVERVRWNRVDDDNIEYTSTHDGIGAVSAAAQ